MKVGLGSARWLAPLHDDLSDFLFTSNSTVVAPTDDSNDNDSEHVADASL